MNNAEFVSVFDISAIGIGLWVSLVAGLLLVAFALFLPRLASIIPFPISRRFTLLLLGFAILGLLAAAMILGECWWKGRARLASAGVHLVEGTIQNFVPMPYQGEAYESSIVSGQEYSYKNTHAQESFIVQGLKFQYSDDTNNGGFHHTASHGGPLRDGLYIRAWYAGGVILKLQIPKASELDPDAQALAQLHALPPGDRDASEGFANKVPCVELTDQGAFVNSRMVPYNQVLTALAALPRSAWPCGRLMIFWSYPPGFTPLGLPPPSVAKKVQSQLDAAGMQYVPIISD